MKLLNSLTLAILLFLTSSLSAQNFFRVNNSSVNVKWQYPSITYEGVVYQKGIIQVKAPHQKVFVSIIDKSYLPLWKAGHGLLMGYSGYVENSRNFKVDPGRYFIKIDRRGLSMDGVLVDITRIEPDNNKQAKLNK